MGEPGAVAQRRTDVEHRGLGDEHVLPERDGPGLDETVTGAIAREEAVLADDGEVTDGQQIGTERHMAGEDRDARPDPRAQRPEVERVERRSDEEDERIRADECPDDPETEVRQAPDADPPILPAPHEDPFGEDRCEGQPQEHHAAEDDRAQIHVEHAGPGGYPLVAPDTGERDEAGVDEERQQLQRPAQDESRTARRGSRRGGGRSEYRTRRLGVREREGQAPDGAVRVDVPHGHRRQAGLLPYPRAEMGHHQRVGTQVLEEVTVGRHMIESHDLGQHRGERRFGAGDRFGEGSCRAGASPEGGDKAVTCAPGMGNSLGRGAYHVERDSREPYVNALYQAFEATGTKVCPHIHNFQMVRPRVVWLVRPEAERRGARRGTAPERAGTRDAGVSRRCSCRPTGTGCWVR